LLAGIVWLDLQKKRDALAEFAMNLEPDIFNIFVTKYILKKRVFVFLSGDQLFLLSSPARLLWESALNVVEIMVFFG
jgi:hypothetical protein